MGSREWQKEEVWCCIASLPTDPADGCRHKEHEDHEEHKERVVFFVLLVVFVSWCHNAWVVQRSESEVNVEVRRPSTEIDLVVEEPGGAAARVSVALLPANFPADGPDVGRQETQPADDDRRDGVAFRNEAVAEDRVVGEVHELTRFAVAPVQEPCADADVGLHGRVTTGGNEANAGSDRDDAQFQILFDLPQVVVHDVSINTRHCSLIEAHVEPGFNVIGHAEEVLGADVDASEILDLEQQRVQVLEKDVVRDA